MLYEGTTGIQALDFIGRKVLGSGGALLQNFTREIHHFCKDNAEVAELKEFVEPLQSLNKKWGSEEHTSELQSRLHLVCRLLLEKHK